MKAVILKEDLETENVVEDVEFYASVYDNDDEIYLGKAIGVGHKLIFTFPPIFARRLTVRLSCKGKIRLKEISVY